MGKALLRPFQLDEGCNDKRLIRQCKTEGKCEVRPFPEEFRDKGKKDWQWFPVLLSADAPVVTTDFTIAFEERNVRAIPSVSSGILVIKPKQRRFGFGSREAMPILQNFKAQFPSWQEISWSDVYAEITEIDVNIRKLAVAYKTDGETIPLNAPELVSRILESISRIQGNAIPLGSS